MDIEKLKAYSIAARDVGDIVDWAAFDELFTPATILALIERLEAAEKQNDELLAALEYWHYCTLKYRYPYEATAMVQGLGAIASVKEQGK